MATMTISVPDPMKDWIDTRIRQGDYASASDYVSDLVRRDRADREPSELTLSALQRLVADARAGGTSEDTVADVLADAKQAARTAGAPRRTS